MQNEIKADSISAWSTLKLLKKVEFGEHGFCLVCNSNGQLHTEDCEMKRHLYRLEIEAGGWNRYGPK